MNTAAEKSPALRTTAINRFKASGTASPIAEAEEFLKEFMAAGPVPQREVKAAAEGNGLSWATVRRATKRLGIQAIRDGMGGGWLWILPKVLIESEDAHLRNMSPSARVSTFGATVPPYEDDDGLEIPKFLDFRAGLT